MIWFTWRQFRTQTWITVGALAALGVVLVITGRSIADAYADANVAACDSDCATAINNFLHQVTTSTSGTVYDLATSILYVVPALIGIFWGAPLLARELETGTHRLAWNQSVTRTRWLATKLAIVGAAAAATVGLLSWAVTSWAHQIDQATGVRITPALFAARGIVPIGYALFAFTLGVTAGMLIRRTVPAMAATLAIYGAAVIFMQEWIRAHLVPASHATNPLDTSSLDTLMIGQGNELTVVASDNLPDAWSCPTRRSPPPARSSPDPPTRNTAGPTPHPKCVPTGSGASACAKTSPTTPPTTSGLCNGPKPASLSPSPSCSLGSASGGPADASPEPPTVEHPRHRRGCPPQPRRDLPAATPRLISSRSAMFSHRTLRRGGCCCSPPVCRTDARTDGPRLPSRRAIRRSDSPAAISPTPRPALLLTVPQDRTHHHLHARRTPSVRR
jgi:ABC-2 family transporter protein